MSSREDWQRRLGPLYGGAVALVHSTPWRWPEAVGDEARSSAWVVAVGVPIGLVAWLAAWVVDAAGIALSVAALVGLATLSAASAALAERGLAETFERWTGHGRSPAAVGVLALVLATLVRAAAMLAVPVADWLGVLIATAVTGRWAAVFLQALGDPIAPEAGRRSLVSEPAPAWLTAALGLAVAAVLVFALGALGLVALAVTAVLSFALGLAAQRRDGGLSAPVVGLAAAIGELVVLAIATIP